MVSWVESCHVLFAECPSVLGKELGREWYVQQFTLNDFSYAVKTPFLYSIPCHGNDWAEILELRHPFQS